MYSQPRYTDITITQIKKGVSQTAAATSCQNSFFQDNGASLIVQKHLDIYVSVLESESARTLLSAPGLRSRSVSKMDTKGCHMKLVLYS